MQDLNIGGVAVFVKSSLKVSEREDLKIINSEHGKVKTENLWLEIVKSTGKKFVVSVIYRHSDGNVTNFSEKLEHSLVTLNHYTCGTITHKIVTDDFNIDLIKFNHHTTTGEYLEMLLQNSFLPMWSNLPHMHLD